jgi:hypothetical protein
VLAWDLNVKDSRGASFIFFGPPQLAPINQVNPAGQDEATMRYFILAVALLLDPTAVVLLLAATQLLHRFGRSTLRYQPGWSAPQPIGGFVGP